MTNFSEPLRQSLPQTRIINKIKTGETNIGDTEASGNQFLIFNPFHFLIDMSERESLLTFEGSE